MWYWLVLASTIATVLVSDLFAHRWGRASSSRSAVIWSLIWIGAGLAFVVFVWLNLGRDAAQNYLVAYLMEQSLSLDNLFVFFVVFRQLEIPESNQRKTLAWGVLGALVFRAIFILVGFAIVDRWPSLTYVCGILLLFAAFQAVRNAPERPKQRRHQGWFLRLLLISGDTQDPRFVVHEARQRKITPLLATTILLESSDIFFALDSIPAAFAVTHDKFIVYSSNAFAILGLRSLYSVVLKSIVDLKYLHYGVAGVLTFAAIKLLSTDWVSISPLASLIVISLPIGVSVWTSWKVPRTETIRPRGFRRGSNDEQSQDSNSAAL